MPIYTRSYRNYEGTFRRRNRWLLIVEQELRILVKSKIFQLLCFGAFLHWLARLLQIVAYDVIIQDPNHVLAVVLQQAKFITVNEQTFFDFLRIQGPLVFLTCLFAGSGMICNDFRNNLMEVYFSKPITWRDYALGKSLTLIAIGLSFTALPAFLLVIIHNFLAPGWETLMTTRWWPVEIFAFSLILVVPIALGVLACSSLLQSQNFAGITAFMILVANLVMAGLLAGFLQNENYLLLSIPVSLDRIGQAIFNQPRIVFSLGWGWPLALVTGLSVMCVAIIGRAVRRAECAP
mgnify:CR=1 FL=1|tara:strand:+ start:367 stop:1242 length:876 start_codon:yes stop_codon:yes gene_type:complete